MIRIGIVFGLVVLLGLCGSVGRAGGILINHEDTDIIAVPRAAMEDAKELLHIGYGHTSHGSQLTTGMQGLIAFANGGGLGLSLPSNFFAFNNGGSGGALDLEEGNSGWLEGDCGYYPDWVNETREYLDDASHSDVNVIIWSWCGQVTGKYTGGTLSSQYLQPMSQLEAEYEDVRFVYMTGHVDHAVDADNKAANQAVRNYCAANDKILYDFADIECYDPKGTFFEFPADNCDYYASATGAKLGNWATEWQKTHTEGVDWYNCSSAHSEPLNANRKAYAAWALWAALAGTFSQTPGDFNTDGFVDAADIDLMRGQIPGTVPPASSVYDLTDDNTIDMDDLYFLVEDILGTHMGDADVDGFVGGDDLDRVLASWGQTDKTWAQGKFRPGTGIVGGDDLDFVLANWGQGTPAGAIPEPASLLLAAGGALALLRKRRA